MHLLEYNIPMFDSYNGGDFNNVTYRLGNLVENLMATTPTMNINYLFQLHGRFLKLW